MVQNEFEVEEFFSPAPSYLIHENTSCVFTPTAIEGAIVCKHKELSFLYAKKKLCFKIFVKKNVDGQITQDEVKCDYLMTIKSSIF